MTKMIMKINISKRGRRTDTERESSKHKKYIMGVVGKRCVCVGGLVTIKNVEG